jgi:hypothetical protein
MTKRLTADKGGQVNQIRCGLTLMLAASLASTGTLRGQSATDAEAAVLRLKQGQVLRTLQDCKSKGQPDNVCKELLESIHRRELRVIARLAPAAKDPAVNQDELNIEMTACYSPNYDYAQLVECWNQLADRLTATRKGQFLLKR